MRVLFTSLRNTGHFQPLVPFVEACLRGGHEVAVAAPPDIAEKAARTGATFLPFGHPGDAGLAPIWARLRGATRDEMLRIVLGEIFAGVCASTALPGLLETIDSFKPSVIVRESQEYAAVLASEKCGIPRARVGISMGESAMFPFVGPSLDQQRTALGVEADPSGARLLRESVLTLFPASFDTCDASGGARVDRFRAHRGAAKALPDWWGARTDPLVYVTLGTVTAGMEAARGAYRPALEAVGALPVRALLTTGGDLPPDALGEVPSNVHVERFVPQDEVLPHAAAILCHGGSGTVIGSLAAGVPMVVMPLFADQPQNAERVKATSAGLVVAPPATADALRAALLRVLEEPTFRATAARFRGEIAALPPVDDAVQALQRIAKGDVLTA